MYVCMQCWTENCSIDVHRIRYKLINWACIDAREEVLKKFENLSRFWPKPLVLYKNVSLTVLIEYLSETAHRVTYNMV